MRWCASQFRETDQDDALTTLRPETGKWAIVIFTVGGDFAHQAEYPRSNEVVSILIPVSDPCQDLTFALSAYPLG